MYLVIKTAHNLLGDRGVKILAEADWPLISSIDLSFNQLKARAIKALVGGRWKKLKTLNLCNLLIRKRVIGSGKKGVVSFVKIVGEA